MGLLRRLGSALHAEVLGLRPVPGAHRVALRATLAMMIALLVLWATGHVEWSIYATFGSFASLYGGGLHWPGRWKLQAAAGLVLTLAVACGVLIALHPSRDWLGVPAAAAGAAIGSGLSDRFRWRPPGPLFVVFAVAACATIPTTGEEVVPALVVAASAALLAVLLGVVDGLLPAPPGEVVPGPQRIGRERALQAARCALAVLIAGGISTAAGISHPYWAMIAAVAPLTVFTLRTQVVRGVHRAGGTFVGVFVAAVLLAAQLPDLAIVLIVPALQGLTELVIARNYGVALVLITPLALLLGQLAHRQPVADIVTARLYETVIGVAVGLTVAVLTLGKPPVDRGAAVLDQ